MTTVHLQGFITSDGKLEIDLPEGLPAGVVGVTLDIPIEPTWTDEEIREMLKPEPKTGAEIVAWLMAQDTSGWEDIEDGAAWVDEQRRKRRERRRW